VTDRPPWGGRRAQRLTAAVLTRDHDDRLGYAPCRWCGEAATTADHWPIARAQGGPDTLDNLVAACLPCNTARGVKLWQDRRRPPVPSRRW
jgi:5-methylcytosine-specific restriction endonuclease McrA